MRPLIYALTGDISQDAIKRIQQLPFCEVFEKIGIEEMKKILEFVESRKRKFKRSKFSNIPSSMNSMSFERNKLKEPLVSSNYRDSAELRIILEDNENYSASEQ